MLLCSVALESQNLLKKDMIIYEIYNILFIEYSASIHVGI